MSGQLLANILNPLPHFKGLQKLQSESNPDHLCDHEKSWPLHVTCYKGFFGECGHRSHYLSHAKRALYHLSYIPVLCHDPVIIKHGYHSDRNYKPNSRSLRSIWEWTQYWPLYFSFIFHFSTRLADLASFSPVLTVMKSPVTRDDCYQMKNK